MSKCRGAVWSGGSCASLVLLLVLVGCSPEELDRAKHEVTSIAQDVGSAAQEAAEVAVEEMKPLVSEVERRIDEMDVAVWAAEMHERSQTADAEFLQEHRPDPETIRTEGDRIHQMFLDGFTVSDDLAHTDQANRVADKVRRTSQGSYTITVIEHELVAAFTHCGGHIYVTTGLLELELTDGELGFLIGHEIAHNLREHTIRPLAYTQRLRETLEQAAGRGAALAADAVERTGEELLPREKIERGAADAAAGLAKATDILTLILYRMVALGYSEELEREADTLGFAVATRAGYGGEGAASVVRKLMAYEEALGVARKTPTGEGNVLAQTLEVVEGHFASHPPGPERVAYLEELAGS